MSQDYIRARFTPRPNFEGRVLSPELQEQVGTELLVRPLWRMDDNDEYPGEWAMANADPQSDLLARTWIASGDLTPITSEPVLDLRFTDVEQQHMAESSLTLSRSTPFRYINNKGEETNSMVGMKRRSEQAVPESNYKYLALRAFALAKWAEDSDFALRDEYVRELDDIAEKLGVSDCKTPEELGIPWPPRSLYAIAADAGLTDDDGTALSGSADVITIELLALAEELKPGIKRADALSAAVAADLAQMIGNRAYPEFSRGQPLMDRIKTFAILISQS